jgi:IclR family transcriptional regulator, pca regulon regulatory protein
MPDTTRVVQRPETTGKKSASVMTAGSTLPDPSALVADKIASLGHDPDFVIALARGLGVLLALSDKRRRMSIAQVSHRTGIPRAAARRSLHTLEKLGFVAADEARRFYLRPRVLSFSHGYLSASPIAVLAQPILDRLSESLREACSLAMLDGEEIVYIARSSSSRIMSPALNVGRRLPAYCTSVGHVMLAHMPATELNDYLAQTRFHPYTDHTPTSAQQLIPLLRAVRELGFAFASQLMEPRLCTLAVPVHDAGGQCVAGINVILQGRLVNGKDMAKRFYRPLHDAALELGSLLLP